MEIRACLSAILERVNGGGGGGGGGGGPTCEEDWQRSGTGEDIFAVPQCVNRVHLRVDPGGTLSDFWFWKRDQVGVDWGTPLAAGRVSTVECSLGNICHFEGRYPIGEAVELAITVRGATIRWTVTRAD